MVNSDVVTPKNRGQFLSYVGALHFVVHSLGFRAYGLGF